MYTCTVFARSNVGGVPGYGDGVREEPHWDGPGGRFHRAQARHHLHHEGCSD